MDGDMNKNIKSVISALETLNTEPMFRHDFLLTWEKSVDELRGVFLVAEMLRNMRTGNVSSRIFDSGLGVSLFRDNSTRTRFSFASACNLLGLSLQDLDEGKSQAAHGETVRETAVMISFLAEVIGIRDDMYIGEGNRYMREFAEALDDGYATGVLEQRPSIINLQCDIDHPTQAMSDTMHLINHFGGVDQLKGKKLAMSWAYSPSYGKPLSVPQGVIGLLTRFGMDVTLAHPAGYEVMPEVIDIAKRNARVAGGTFTQTNDMGEAFAGADVVYPKSWAPFGTMEKRTELYRNGDSDGIDRLEQELLAQNGEHTDWECTDELMSSTSPDASSGEALYLHCLPADISDVSCSRGEVSAPVFDRFRELLYRQAGYKPYVIAAMILLSKTRDPAGLLSDLINGNVTRSRV
jgi:knotted carbamoyltransferase YgeW